MHEVNKGKERVSAAVREMSFEGRVFEAATVEVVLAGMSHSTDGEMEEALYIARNTAYFSL